MQWRTTLVGHANPIRPVARRSQIARRTRSNETAGTDGVGLSDIGGIIANQPRISDLLRGKIHLFSLDMLMDMASTVGMSPEVSVTPPRAKPVAVRRKRPVSVALVE